MWFRDGSALVCLLENCGCAVVAFSASFLFWAEMEAFYFKASQPGIGDGGKAGAKLQRGRTERKAF